MSVFRQHVHIAVRQCLSGDVRPRRASVSAYEHAIVDAVVMELMIACGDRPHAVVKRQHIRHKSIGEDPPPSLPAIWRMPRAARGKFTARRTPFARSNEQLPVAVFPSAAPNDGKINAFGFGCRIVALATTLICRNVHSIEYHASVEQVLIMIVLAISGATEWGCTCKC